MVAKVADKLVDNPVADDAMDYARQIWLAGLGAFAKAEREGSKLFETLVKRGEEVEAQARQKVEDAVEDLKGRFEKVKDKATKNWNKLEKVFQERVARALHRLGVPSREDIQELTRQVNALQESIQEMIKAEEAPEPLKKANLRSVIEAA
jgi:poly(hydroxyalkanoate) granule-associated protein